MKYKLSKENMLENINEMFLTAEKTAASHQKNAIILKEYYECVSIIVFRK